MHPVATDGDPPVASTSAVREYNAAEEKALRKARLGFSGYPAGPYYGLSKEDAAASVRSDHPVLKDWSDNEINDTIDDLDSTLVEILVQSPIGPFLVLSAISILRDGMDLGEWGKIEPMEALSFLKIQF